MNTQSELPSSEEQTSIQSSIEYPESQWKIPTLKSSWLQDLTANPKQFRPVYKPPTKDPYLAVLGYIERGERQGNKNIAQSLTKSRRVNFTGAADELVIYQLLFLYAKRLEEHFAKRLEGQDFRSLIKVNTRGIVVGRFESGSKAIAQIKLSLGIHDQVLDWNETWRQLSEYQCHLFHIKSQAEHKFPEGFLDDKGNHTVHQELEWASRTKKRIENQTTFLHHKEKKLWKEIAQQVQTIQQRTSDADWATEGAANQTKITETLGRIFGKEICTKRITPPD